jgi:diguanylate cyclase (GGDEF)-like protein
MLGRYKMRSDKFETLSITDPLTGLLNRAGIHNIVKKMNAKAGPDSSIGLMLIDIDHFKAVNDNFGHDVGDYVITNLSDVIKNTIRGSDYLGRWGGEEFIILCPNSNRDSISQLANNIRQTVAATTMQTQEHKLSISVSIGYGLKAHNENFEQALKRIDIALYQAKDAGRNRAEAA